MILPFITVAPTASMGRGVFTAQSIAANTVIEIAPVIVMFANDRPWLDKTLLHDYIFEWGYDKKQCAMALGYVPLYNHSYVANCEYAMDYEAAQITITTVRNIEPGEELFINYNGDWDDITSVWFNAT
jgi:hypothetical protein